MVAVQNLTHDTLGPTTIEGGQAALEREGAAALRDGRLCVCCE